MAAAAQKLLNCAAEVLDNSGGGEGVKRVMYTAEVPNHMRSQLSAIVLGVIKHKEQLLKIAEKDGLFETLASSGINVGQNMVLALLFEAVLGSRRIRGTEPVVKVIKERKEALLHPKVRHTNHAHRVVEAWSCFGLQS